MCTFLYSRAVIVGLPQQNSKLGNGDTAGNFRSNFEAPLYKTNRVAWVLSEVSDRSNLISIG